MLRIQCAGSLLGLLRSASLLSRGSGPRRPRRTLTGIDREPVWKRDSVEGEHLVTAAQLAEKPYVLFNGRNTPGPFSELVQIGSTQFKVCEGDVVMVEKMDAEVNQLVCLDKVLAVEGRDFTVVGRPVVTQAKVLAVVEEQCRTKKVLIAKNKRRGGRHRKQMAKGRRQSMTVLRIKEVVYRLWPREMVADLEKEDGNSILSQFEYDKASSTVRRRGWGRMVTEEEDVNEDEFCAKAREVLRCFDVVPQGACHNVKTNEWCLPVEEATTDKEVDTLLGELERGCRV